MLQTYQIGGPTCGIFVQIGLPYFLQIQGEKLTLEYECKGSMPFKPRGIPLERHDFNWYLGVTGQKTKILFTKHVVFGGKLQHSLILISLTFGNLWAGAWTNVYFLQVVKFLIWR